MDTVHLSRVYSLPANVFSGLSLVFVVNRFYCGTGQAVSVPDLNNFSWKLPYTYQFCASRPIGLYAMATTRWKIAVEVILQYAGIISLYKKNTDFGNIGLSMSNSCSKVSSLMISCWLLFATNFTNVGREILSATVDLRAYRDERTLFC